jgi:hypothetical protein
MTPTAACWASSSATGSCASGHGRVWTVRVAPHGQRDGPDHVVLRAGDHVRHVDGHFADDYVLVTGPDAL